MTLRARFIHDVAEMGGNTLGLGLLSFENVVLS